MTFPLNITEKSKPTFWPIQYKLHRCVKLSESNLRETIFKWLKISDSKGKSSNQSGGKKDIIYREIEMRMTEFLLECTSQKRVKWHFKHTIKYLSTLDSLPSENVFQEVTCHTKELTTKQSHRHRKQIYGYQKEKVGEGWVRSLEWTDTPYYV